MSAQQVPAFTPVIATPVQPAAPENGTKPRKATVARGKKKSRPAKATEPVEKRPRRSRVAPLQMDAAQALSALAGLSKKEVESLQTLVAVLNPLPRPARQRVLASVASILGQ